MPKIKKRLPIAQRLKAAATQAGITGTEIARQLGVTRTILYRWWYGDRAPTADHLVAYARIVGKPVEYFYGHEEEIQERPREIADLLVQWARLLMAGEEPGSAFDRVTGVPAELTPRERQTLTGAAPQMREELRQAAGGDWDLLTEEDRRQILDQVLQLAERRRSPPPGNRS